MERSYVNHRDSFCDLNCFCDPGTTNMGPYHKKRPLQRVPDETSDDQASEKLFAADMKSLTFQERETITNEIHGVGSTVIDETVERVKEALKSLRENYLASQNHNFTNDAGTNSSPDDSRQNQPTLSVKRDAYDRAVFLRPMLAMDDKFHLMFLRAQRFDPYLAAQNMFMYFENKRALFGDELLTQKITLKDLTDHEVRLVREGTIQLLAGREATGRGIGYYRMSQLDLSSHLALKRSMWYIFTAIEDDDDMQRRGVVVIGDWQGSFRHPQYEIFAFMHSIQPLIQNWFFRGESVHSIYGNGNLDGLFKTLSTVFTKNIRVRHRFHFGSQLETNYILRTFGIDMGDKGSSSKSSWSILPGSEVKTMDEYIQRRSLAEEQWLSKEKVFQESSAVVALVPNPYDILMVRSKFASTWPGNVFYRNIVAKYSQRYIDPDSNLRIDKTLIIMEVIHVLQKDRGSRFLSRKETRWVVAEDAAIQKKVNQSLRQAASRTSVGKHALGSFS